MIEALVLAAALPLALWIAWRIQALSVDGPLRRGMFQLLRHQRRLYDIVSWSGVLLHELAHAVFLILGGHGIKNFKVGRDSGHVTPRRLRTHLWGHLTFLLAALAPMFVAPVAVLGLLLWARPDLAAFFVTQEARLAAVGATFGGAPGVLLAFGSFLLGDVVPALLGLDLATGVGAAVFVLAVLAIPSARPSHIKNDGEDEGDIAVLRRTIRSRPLPAVSTLALFLAVAAALAIWAPAWFWWLALAAIALPVAAITLAVVGGIGWWAVAQAGRVRPWLAWIPIAAAVAIQVVPRLFEHVPPLVLNLASLGAFVVLTILLRLVASRRW